MVVKNYNRGYFDKFDCVIHGRIVVFGAPEMDIIKQLLNKMPIDSSYPYLKRNAIIKFNNADKLFHLGTTPTDFIAKSLNLKGYKKGNYMFDIV